MVFVHFRCSELFKLSKTSTLLIDGPNPGMMSRARPVGSQPAKAKEGKGARYLEHDLGDIMYLASFPLFDATRVMKNVGRLQHQ